ncbi:glucosidase 2 subunit beta [Bacillus rossius redtenbacheri]|uniref:glucosidase 2 subunit beta n=1 Tax=Bacillus rossius redtenbacheri TaxID=93214 RepID=UPI002FDDB235
MAGYRLLKGSSEINSVVSAALLFFTLITINNVKSEIVRPRGVSISKASLYAGGKDFTCFDGSLTVPFTYVNDDYCDCPDGSDEPGTPACPNGTFHCTNAGHRPLNLPSSRVNDGICDCCDASDEYGGRATCSNNCNELGLAARIEAQKMAEVAKQGSELRAQLSKRGHQLRQEKQERLQQLERERQEAEGVRQEKERLKQAAEALENSALDKYRKLEEQEKQQASAVERKAEEREAFDHFHRLDSNQDGKLDIAELKTQQTFDQNKDGAVSDDELRALLDGKDEIAWEDFLGTAWSQMKPLLMLDRGLFQPPATEPEAGSEAYREEAEEEERGELAGDGAGEGEYAGEEEEEEEEEEQEEQEQEEQEQEPAQQEEEAKEEEEKKVYDEETQHLIDEATRARSQFEEADRRARDLQREIDDISESLKKDYGTEDEFASLAGECFEYTDMEYTYKLCPFDQVTQRSKGGGAETRLGTWMDWAGPESDRYQVMLYSKGQSCWNGPQRSTHVRLKCGTDSAVTHVSEPNRCEYEMQFSTPGACRLPAGQPGSHDEL